MEVQVPRPKQQRSAEGRGHLHGSQLHDEEEESVPGESTSEDYLETETGRCVCVCVCINHHDSELLHALLCTVS